MADIIQLFLYCSDEDKTADGFLETLQSGVPSSPRKVFPNTKNNIFLMYNFMAFYNYVLVS